MLHEEGGDSKERDPGQQRLRGRNVPLRTKKTTELSVDEAGETGIQKPYFRGP